MNDETHLAANPGSSGAADPVAPPPRRPLALLFVCFMISGMSGLIYEVAWVRSLEIVFGSTTFAVATVLASFMGGLAIGSWWMGRSTDRFRHWHPLRLYAALEAILAGVALVIPVLLRLQAPLYRALSSGLLDSFVALSLLRLVLCAAVLIVPTFLMGATLPVLSRVAGGERGSDDREDERQGRDQRGDAGRVIGLLYATNTIGAVLGCATAGLWLLPALGLMRTQWLAVGLNLVAAAGALALAPWFGRPGAREAAGRGETAAGAGGSAAGPGKFVTGRVTGSRATPGERLLVAAYAVSGLTAMLYEVAWSRLLILVLGSSTYSYTIMLTTFLLGLALGAWIGVRLLRVVREPLLAVVLCQVLIAVTTWLSLFLVEELPYLYLLAHDHLHPSPGGLLGVQWMLAAALMVLPTLGLGAMFPVTVGGLAPDGERAPRVVGWAYAWNTVGAIGGSLLAGFWLVPGPGTRLTILVGIGLNTLVALVALLRVREGAVLRLRRPLAAALTLFLVNLAVPNREWRPEILSSGMFRYVDQYAGLDRAAFRVKARRGKGEILMFDEGLTCTVTVFRTVSSLTLAVNGKPDASTPPGLPEPFGTASPARRGDLPTQVLLGQIPMLLAPDWDETLVIGLGSGVTLGSVLTHPAKRVDCVELEDAVVRASRFFEAQNGRPLADPRVRLLVNDARSQLALSSRSYDLIISEPSNPWTAGASGLFTRDFFTLARSRLRPGGVFTQWVQLYELHAEDFLTLLRSFLAVFPEAHVFRVGDDAILIGSRSSLRIDLSRMVARATPGVRADLLRVGIAAPEDLLGHYWIGGEDLRRSVGAGPINTDDNMLIEFVAPLRMLARDRARLEARTRELIALFQDTSRGLLPVLALPDGDPGRVAGFWTAMARAALDRETQSLAWLYADHALSVRRTAAGAIIRGEAIRRSGDEAGALSAWEAAAEEFPEDEGIRFALVALHRDRGEWAEVCRQSEVLRRLRPADPLPRSYMGEALHHLGDHTGAIAILMPPAWSGAGGSAGVPGAVWGGGSSGGVLPEDGPLAELGRLLAVSLCAVGRCAEALAPLEAHLDRRPADREARLLLVRALRSAGEAARAAAVEKQFAPDAAARGQGLLSQAQAAWDAGDPVRARGFLEEARLYLPDDDAVTLALAVARATTGDRAGAFAVLESALRARPDTPWAIGYFSELLAGEGRRLESEAMAARHIALTGQPWEPIGEALSGVGPRSAAADPV